MSDASRKDEESRDRHHEDSKDTASKTSRERSPPRSSTSETDPAPEGSRERSPPHSSTNETDQAPEDSRERSPLRSSTSETDTSKFDFFHLHLQTQSSTLRRLEETCGKYKTDPNIDEFFRQLKTRGNNKPDSAHRWTFYNGMKEINQRVDRFSFDTDQVKCFLDLGAAPGGFSWWLLEKNPSAKGLGITLPPESGGFSMGFEANDRYNFIYKDVLQDPEKIWSQNMVDEVAEPQFDLCIAGCMFRWAGMQEPDSEEEKIALSQTRQVLRYSQLLSALLNLQDRGTLILVSKAKPQLSQVEMTCGLKSCFEHIYPIKPERVHAVRSSYYLVGVGYQREKAVETKLIEKLRDASKNLKNISSDWIQKEPMILEGTHESIVNNWTNFALKHYEPMWEIQANAMQQQMDRNSGNNRPQNRDTRQYSTRPYNNRYHRTGSSRPYDNRDYHRYDDRDRRRYDDRDRRRYDDHDQRR